MMVIEVNKMKKWFVVLGIWFVVSVSMVCSNAKSTIDFEIIYDSQTKTTFPLKEAIEQKYAELVEGIHESSYLNMLKSNLDYLKVQDNLQLTFDQHLKVIEGDGNGEVITGTLEAYQICLPQVERKSIFDDMGSWFFS